MRLLPDEILADHLSTLEVLDSIFPLPGELVLPSETTSAIETLRAHLDSSSSPDRPIVSLGPLKAVVRVTVDPPPGSAESEDDDGWMLDIELSLPIAVSDEEGDSSEGGELDLIAPPTTIILLQPTWINNVAFQDLQDSLPVSAPELEADTTSLLLELTEHLKLVGPKLIPPLAQPTSTTPNPSSPPHTDTPPPSHIEPNMLPLTSETVICLSKMHHIVNLPKLRRLKALAITHCASGYVKVGKPGVMLYELESKERLHEFLKGVRGLNYLEFHHLSSTPLILDSPEPTKHKAGKKESKKEGDGVGKERLNGGKVGLVEIEETKELVAIAEGVGRKEWFRSGMGMTGGGG